MGIKEARIIIMEDKKEKQNETKNVSEFREIVTEMADLYEKKNANYGNSFSQLFEKLGPVSALVPLWNKLDRATNLIQGGKNDFESVEDTLKDLACYAVMSYIEFKNHRVAAPAAETSALAKEAEAATKTNLLA